MNDSYDLSFDLGKQKVSECFLATFNQLEGLLLDPIYTGKTLHGLAMYVEKKPIILEELVVFAHTGELPLLFAYADAFN